MVSWPKDFPEAPTGAFWRFSLGFYRRPGVAAACLDLQDRFGRDINLLLFACWVGISGRGRIGVADLAKAEAVLDPWRKAIVEPLRVVRRLLKEEPDSSELYAAVQAVELRAERHSQHRLEGLAPPAAVTDPQQRLADASANLSLYLGRGAAYGASAPIRMALAAELTSPS
jgi:uncharacterized protein (TIGR02444 family)